MNIQLEYFPYLDIYGLCHDRRGAVSGNGLRYTAEMLIALKKNKALDKETRKRTISALRQTQLIAGLYRKHPEEYQKAQASIDDYIAIGLISSILDAPNIAWEVLVYGGSSSPLWTYNNVVIGHFSLQAWMGRFIAFIPHFKLAGLDKLNFLDKWLWWLNLKYQTHFNQSQDGFVLTWMLCYVAYQTKRFESSHKAIKKFQRALRKRYPGGIGQILQQYFADKNHPSVKWLWNEYGPIED